MRIADYSFGRITVDGTEYRTDVIIWPDWVEDNWWRSEGHRLVPEDLPAIMADPPDVLIIGTGHDGRMEVSPETLEKLRASGMEVIVDRTDGAVREFNNLLDQEARVAAALHLTC